MRIYDSTGTAIVAKRIPISDRYGTTGLFQYWQFLTSSFSTGKYYAVYEWTLTGGYNGQSMDCFDILAGGDSDGQLLSLFFFDRPEAKFIVGQTDAGTIIRKRNPRI